MRSEEKAIAREQQPAALGADARAGRIDGSAGPAAAAVEKMNVAEEVGPGPVQFLVTLRVALRLDDPAQVEPGANHLVEAHVYAAQQALHLLPGPQRGLVNVAVGRLRNDLRAVDPGDAVVPRDDQLRADALDFDFAEPAAHAQGLDRQPLALAGGLRDIAGGGQLAAIEVAHDLLAARASAMSARNTA